MEIQGPLITSTLFADREYLSSLMPNEALRELTLSYQVISREGNRKPTALDQIDCLCLLWLIWQCPLSSAENLATIYGLDTSRITGLLTILYGQGFVGISRLGNRFQRMNRYYLERRGVHRVRDSLNVQLEWPVTDVGLLRVFRSLPIAEVFYQLGPRIIADGLINSLPLLVPGDRSQDGQAYTIDKDSRIERFRWLQSGRSAIRTAVVDYRTKEGGEFQLVLAWHGLQHRNGELAGDFHQTYDEMVRAPEIRYGGAATPAGLVVVVPDQLGYLQVQTSLNPAIPTGVVDQEGRVLRPLKAVYQQGNLSPLQNPNLRLGNVADVPNKISKVTGLSTVCDRPTYRALRIIDIFPELNQEGYRTLLKQERADTKASLNSLTEAKLSQKNGRLFQPSVAGHKLVASMDRVALATVQGRNKTGRDKPLHKRGLAKILIWLRKRNFPAAPEWRLVVNIKDVSQIKPDLWVLLPYKNGQFVWWAVEFERTAKNREDWTLKLDTYRTFKDEGFPVPCLMICETKEAAETCRLGSSDLPIKIFHLKAFIRGQVKDEHHIWQYQDGAQTKAVDLSDLPVEPHLFLIAATQDGAVAYD